MAHMDIFDNDAFSLVNMTTAVQKLPTVPTFLGSLGLFGTGEGVTTNIVSIEQKGQTLEIIETTPRGSPIPMGSTDKASLRHFSIPRIAKGDQIFAAQVQGVRAFGTESELQTVAQVVSQKQQKLDTELALTMEYHRLGAIQGILLDKDGSTLYNYFDEFNITPPTEIDFDLDAVNPVEGVLLTKIRNSVKRPLIRALGASWTPMCSIIGLCGDTFYDQFTTHNDVRVTYKNWQAAESLRSADVFSSFRFGEIDWVNYQGTDDNSTVAIGTGKVKFVVKGVPGLYRRVNGPGETMETVNTIGQEKYSMLVRDLQRNMWVQPEVYAYPLHMVTRPEALLSGRNT